MILLIDFEPGALQVVLHLLKFDAAFVIDLLTGVGPRSLGSGDVIEVDVGIPLRFPFVLLVPSHEEVSDVGFLRGGRLRSTGFLDLLALELIVDVQPSDLSLNSLRLLNYESVLRTDGVALLDVFI